MSDVNFAGQSDIPLNDLGEKQAQAVGRYLKKVKFDRIYSSDLIRCLQVNMILDPRIVLLISLCHWDWNHVWYSQKSIICWLGSHLFCTFVMATPRATKSACCAHTHSLSFCYKRHGACDKPLVFCAFDSRSSTDWKMAAGDEILVKWLVSWKEEVGGWIARSLTVVKEFLNNSKFDNECCDCSCT